MKTRIAPRQSSRNYDSDSYEEAVARAQLCAAFDELVRHFTVVGAARLLGVSPSTLSGKNSLPAKLRNKGTAGLLLKHQPPKSSRVSAWTQLLKSGHAIIYDGQVRVAMPGRES